MNGIIRTCHITLGSTFRVTKIRVQEFLFNILVQIQLLLSDIELHTTAVSTSKIYIVWFYILIRVNIIQGALDEVTL